MAVAISAIGYFLPIFAFLLVFIIGYALIRKSEIIKSEFSVFLLAFILASFFIVQANLVEFVQFSSAWFSVIAIVLFFMFAVMAFLPGGAPDVFKDSKWVGWAVFGVMIILFMLSAGKIFDTAVNWAIIRGWASSSWFGMILLLVIAGIVAWKIKE